MAEPGTRSLARRSLRWRMLWRLLLPLIATWFVGSAAAFYLSWGLAGRAFDRTLLDDAYAVAANVAERDGALTLNLSQRQVESVLFDREEKEYFSIYDANGGMVAGDVDLRRVAAVPIRRGEFFADGVLAGADLRVAQLQIERPQPFTVVVGQTMRSRHRLLQGVLARSLAPQLVLLLLLGLYLRRQISQELAPLGRLQQELDRRHSSDLDPIELRPDSSDLERLRDSVNSLLARIAQGVQAQREFAGNVAHDLRTPLAGIRALAEYGLARDEPVVWREQLQSIVRSEDRASRLVDQLLALALADEAQNSVRLEAVRVDELVRRILISFVARADAAGLELSADGLDRAVSARAAPVLLEGILVNLIDNALRYGGGAALATLSVSVAQAGDEVRIAVTDSGRGLEPEQRERLARRWTQGMAGLQLGAGSGLGLAIASRYATLMGGRLTLESGPGERGLCATVHLRTAEPRA